MVGGGKEGVLIRDGVVFDLERRALRAEGIGHRDLKIAGEALLHIRREAVKAHRVLAQNLGVPHIVVITPGAAVQAGLAVIFLKPVLLAVQGEARAADAVADAPDHAAEMTFSGLIARRAVVAQHHVGQAAVPVGHADRLDIGAVVKQGAACADGIGDGICPDLFSGGESAEGMNSNSHKKTSCIVFVWIVPQT